MSIQILPPRLANQIAAGEVVERPASVVKELVENSLDAGATQIDIDIEKGGAKLIRIRDNGQGIPKDELGLALSRHATSKIKNLDDLEAIMSLGFRGEALASVSSVSRLTMTSRTQDQSEAWSAYAQGREMEVTLKPAAHPVGTTVEVLDLFFNTPARRKFLRTEKTEFNHIDELLKRIALSRLDVSIRLTHNGKSIRQYRAAQTQKQIEKRIAAVCSQHFIDHSVAFEQSQNDLKVKGYLATPEAARAQADTQYCYVNGRMMRDKLINHAIRQSYETALTSDKHPAYVVYIEIDPHQVDVNVHPAKHEVRFHEARYVHDFIYQVLRSSLEQALDLEAPAVSQSAYASDYMPSSSDSSARFNTPADRNTSTCYNEASYPAAPKAPQADRSARGMPSQGSSASSRQTKPARLSEQVGIYQALFETLPRQHQAQATAPVMNTAHTPAAAPSDSQIESQPLHVEPISVQASKQTAPLGKALSVIDKSYLLLESGETDAGHLLLNLPRAEYWRSFAKLDVTQSGTLIKPLTAQPLLIPLQIKLEKDLILTEANQQDLQVFGIQIEFSGQKLALMGVPEPLRHQNLQLLIPKLCQWIKQTNWSADDPRALSTWLAKQIKPEIESYTLSQALELITSLEQFYPNLNQLNDPTLLQAISFKEVIGKLKSTK